MIPTVQPSRKRQTTETVNKDPRLGGSGDGRMNR